MLIKFTVGQVGTIFLPIRITLRADEYEKETGVKVIVETAANNEYESTLTAKMSTKSAPTLFQINGNFFINIGNLRLEIKISYRDVCDVCIV